MTHYTNPDIRHLAARIDKLEGTVQLLLDGRAADIADRLRDSPQYTIVDPMNAAVTQEIADELKPDRYQARHKGRGRYVIWDDASDIQHLPVDSPLGVSFLTKDQAAKQATELNGR